MGFKTLLFQRIDMGWFGSSNKKEKSKATGGYPSQGGGYPTQNNASSNVQEKQPLPQQMPPTGQPPPYGAAPQYQQQPYQQQPYQQQPYQQQPYPTAPNSINAQPTPQNVTQAYQVTYQPAPVQQARFDSGARFDGNSQARVPPPPPGVQMNSAQLAAAQGQSAQVGQKKAGFLSGGDGGGTSIMGGGLF